MNRQRLTNSNAQEYIIIVGCGLLGAHLANTLSGEGRNTLIIDKNKESFHRLSPLYDGHALAGDATEISTLNEAQIERATSVIVVAGDDNTNIFVSQIAKELFHVRHVIAQLQDPEREGVYREFGIETICVSALSTKEIERLLNVFSMRKDAV